MRFRTILVILAALLFVIACDDDDDTNDNVVEERDRTEQQMVDNDSLLGYFETHYYNSEFLESLDNPEITDIEITEAELDSDSLPIVPEGYTLLIDEMVSIVNPNGKLQTIVDPIPYVDTDYTYYILKLNQGGGEPKPEFPDTIGIAYEGFTQDGDVFDIRVTPEVIPMLRADGAGVIEGWRRMIPFFHPAENLMSNPDGTISFDNFGFGVLFIPSGLGYYSRQQGQISPYSNLIFKIGLKQVATIDHDADFIDSYKEDLDGSLNVLDDDTDEDGAPNYIDFDDDGDEVLTRNELKPKQYIVPPGEEQPEFAENEIEVNRTVEEDGTIIIDTVLIMDTNSNGIPDYLEVEIAIDYSSDTE